MESEANTTSSRWAEAVFSHVDLGDTRRAARLVQMAAAACERPSGKVAAVFTSDRQREGAYDFLENPDVPTEAIVEGLAKATVERCVDQPFVVVPVDGTSVTVVDWTGERDFGRIGSDHMGGRGLKAIDAIAVDAQGTPIGLLALSWWARSAERSPARDTFARRARPLEQKETRYWIQTVQAAARALDERRVRGWFQIDREGDGYDLLHALSDTEHQWTVRGNADRSIQLEGGDHGLLRAQLERGPVSGTYALPVVARPGRKPREARMLVRVARVVLRMRDRKTSPVARPLARLPVTVVWAREEGSAPVGEDPIDWLLYTNRPVQTFEDAQLVIWAYTQRWRVEEFHRTWKRGDCDIESTQLRSSAAVQRWATIVAAVALRIERLKRLARFQSQRPAILELSPFELRALKALKFGPEPPQHEPTIAEAVLWLAELGGYANKYSGKPPGATVLGRALKYLRPAARMLQIQQVYGK